jgi:hypothetical protein
MKKLYEMTRGLLAESGNPALGCYVTGYQALAAEGSGLIDEAIQG